MKANDAGPQANGGIPRWDPGKPDDSLHAVKEWAVEKAEGNLGWYRKARQSKKKGSTIIRVTGIVLGALGALCPLLDATLQNLEREFGKVDLGEFGYVLIAGAAAVLAYDRYFGLSSGWIRYMLSELAIGKLIRELEYDWLLLRSSTTEGSVADRSRAALSRLKEFSLKVEDVVREETDAWATEFRSNMAELEKTLKKEAEARAPGSVQLSVPNAGDFEEVAISVDGRDAGKLTTGTDELLTGLTPGIHKVAVTGTQQGKARAASKLVAVQAGTTTSVSLAVPSV